MLTLMNCNEIFLVSHTKKRCDILRESYERLVCSGIKKRKLFESITFKELLLLAVRTGLEPATPCVTGTYSNQLNYRTGYF